MGVYLILLSTIPITVDQGSKKCNKLCLKSECSFSSALVHHSLGEVPFFLPPSFKSSSHSAVPEGREEEEQWEQHPHLHTQRGSLTIGSKSFWDLWKIMLRIMSLYYWISLYSHFFISVSPFLFFSNSMLLEVGSHWGAWGQICTSFPKSQVSGHSPVAPLYACVSLCNISRNKSSWWSPCYKLPTCLPNAKAMPHWSNYSSCHLKIDTIVRPRPSAKAANHSSMTPLCFRYIRR